MGLQGVHAARTQHFKTRQEGCSSTCGSDVDSIFADLLSGEVHECWPTMISTTLLIAVQRHSSTPARKGH